MNRKENLLQSTYEFIWSFVFFYIFFFLLGDLLFIDDDGYIYINRDGFNQKFHFDDDFLCRIAHEMEYSSFIVTAS